MTWSVIGNAGGQQTYTVTGLLSALSGINPPAAIAFPSLGNTNATNLLTNQSAGIVISPNAQVVRSIGLITCASVIWLGQTSGTGYVYHANSGVVPRVEFNNAINATGGNPAAVYCVYAHPGANDPGYTSSINDMIGWGLPTNNIVQISNLAITNFGMNNLSQVGF